MAALLNIILAPFRNIIALLFGFFLGYVFALTNIIPGEVVLEAVTIDNIQYIFETGVDYATELYDEFFGKSMAEEASDFVMDIIES